MPPRVPTSAPPIALSVATTTTTTTTTPEASTGSSSDVVVVASSAPTTSTTSATTPAATAAAPLAPLTDADVVNRWFYIGEDNKQHAYARDIALRIEAVWRDPTRHFVEEVVVGSTNSGSKLVVVVYASDDVRQFDRSHGANDLLGIVVERDADASSKHSRFPTTLPPSAKPTAARANDSCDAKQMNVVVMLVAF